MGNLTRLDELYHAALAQPEDGRTSFLAEACAGDDALRHELESLLAHTGTGNGDSFLNQVFTSPSTSEPRRAVCGEQIGPYTIVDFIGAGEMGEVYRATDTKLKRQVAIKILPPSLATDAQRLTRFQREAEVLAALNHPNIAAIYGLEESPPTRDGEAGLRALVMELVEGPTLESMLASGGPVTGRAAQRSERKRTAALHKGLPCDQALSIARQIAEALEAAHEHNIIHRDLKPANIKVRSDGVLKLLDFGLAKALDRAGDADRSRPLVDPAGVVVTEPDSPNAQNRPAISPSRSSAPPAHLRPDDEKLTITGTGMILGTAAYMSPEQAHGHEDLDRRVDLWAFGVVLWEMLTGTRPFDGATMSDTLATVARTEPDWTALPANTPALARRLLRRCLEKDRRQRLDSAAMARLEIEDALAAPLDDLNASATASMHHTRWSFVVLAAAAASGILALIGPTMLSRRDSPPPAMPETRLDIVTPATSDPISFALSPDGRQLAFVASGGGTSRLWLRAFADGTARPLPGTEGAAFPFWSPDSQSVGFFADSRLKRLDIIAGAPQTVASAPAGRGGTWNADGIILFAASISRALSRVAASGGPAAAARTH